MKPKLYKLAVEGSPLRQRVHGMWPWLKIISLGGSEPASCCGPGQLSSMAIPPWHLAAGPRGAHYAGWYPLLLQGELMIALKGGKLKCPKDGKVNHIIV